MGRSKPMSREEVAASSNERLESMRQAGTKWVEVFGCNHPPDECEAIRAMQGQPIEIEFAPSLPLPGCDKEFCKCIIGAVPPPKKGS